MKHSISLIINGDPVDAIVKDNLTLLDFLRDQLFLTGTKKGCEEGECGACTVMLDGKPVNSCCTLAVECDGHEIITVEGIAREGMLHPIQKQFIEKWALQCGYCTPGMIMSAKALLDAVHLNDIVVFLAQKIHLPGVSRRSMSHRACKRTFAPLVTSSHVVNSSLLWLIPLTLGTKIMPILVTCERLMLS